MTHHSMPQPEFSRLIPVDRLSETEIVEEITATPEERAALARRFGLQDLDRLSATVRLGRGDAKSLVRLSGHMVADVTQTCVVSLAPVKSHLDESFTQLYTLSAAPAAPRELVIEATEEEPPEPIGPDGIDIGEAVAQQLALALDPYPRAPGAVLPEAARPAKEEAGAEGPFAALKALKKGR